MKALRDIPTRALLVFPNNPTQLWMRGHNVTMFPTIVECVLVATFEDGFWMYDTAEYEPKPFHDATEATPLAKDGA